MPESVTLASYFTGHGLSSPFFLKSQSNLAKLEQIHKNSFLNKNCCGNLNGTAKTQPVVGIFSVPKI